MAARLQEITVDPKTVVISKKVDASTVGVPEVTADLKAGTYKYDAKISMGGQQMALKLSTTIQDRRGAWTAVENIDTPMGAMLDTVTLEKGSLTVRKRSVEQDSVAIQIEFSGGKIIGRMEVSGETSRSPRIWMARSSPMAPEPIS